ncbi:MAG: SpoIIE family protein phosphatase, partial [Leptospiraceae bacterium]|nr:SpoIIE family protein phosphatase [Leptospiraceae bacterium]
MENMSGVPLGRNLALWRTADLEATPESVLANAADEFQLLQTDRPGLGFSRDTCWLRLDVTNPGERRTWLLEFATPSLDYIDIYRIDANAVTHLYRGGDHVPFDERTFAYRNAVAELTAPAQSTIHYLIRVRTTGALNLFLRAWDREAFQQAVVREQIAEGLYFGIMLAMLIYNLFVYFGVHEISYLYYSVFLVFFILMQLAVNGMGYQYLWSAWPGFSDYGVPVFTYSAVFSALLFTRSFINTPRLLPRLNRLIDVLLVLAAAGLLFLLVRYLLGAYVIVVLSNIAAVVSIAAVIIISIVALFRNSRAARFYLIGWAGLLCGVLVTVFRNTGLLPAFFFSDYSLHIGSIALVMLLSLGLIDTINQMRRKLQSYSTDLEQQVSERTADLNSSLNEVRSLKRQQDGDYYLTSLLIRPLNTYAQGSEKVHVHSLLRQYKKFQFRDRESDLGGDVCIAQEITLCEKKYTVFLNGDAMGKSMQGAGGALVLGSVFTAIIERARIGEVRRQSPERWLKNAFIELDHVFQCFDGSMLVSVVMGLLEENTGFLCLINAEHPATVLFRSDKASFLGVEHTYTKLGSGIRHGNIQIYTTNLKPGDVIILGSDGRDDLRMQSDDASSHPESLNEQTIDRIDESQPWINHDETLFLRVVEEARGDLDSIEQLLRRTGEITDDLSLMRIAYDEPAAKQERNRGEQVRSHDEAYYQRYRELFERAKEHGSKRDYDTAIDLLKQAERVMPENLNVLKSLARVLFHTKDYGAAGEYARRTLERSPAENDFLYMDSYCRRKSGDLNGAIESGERLRLREPEDMRNLLNLARS